MKRASPVKRRAIDSRVSSADAGSIAQSPGAAPAASRDRPAFYDWGQSMASAWDAWVATHAGTRHVACLAEIRLRALVALARERSPFYARLYRAVPDEPRISELPVVTKSDLMTHFDAAVTDRDVTRGRVEEFLADEHRVGHPFLERYAVWTSSGTTGEPGIFIHDGRALAVYDALESIRFRQIASPGSFASAYLAGERYAMVSATGGHFAGNATVERLRWLHPAVADRARVFSVLEPLSALVRALNDYHPTLVATYPTAASLLADEQLSGRLAIRPREVWTGGERLSTAARAHIAGAFRCPVRDGYGSSECLAIAWDCGHALHLNADWVLLEPVDERYHPLPPGVASQTALVTNLANRVQPLIRYDLGDSVTLLDRPCDCGSPLPAIRVEGRCDEVPALTDAAGRTVKLLPLALTTVLEDQAGVYRFQLVQTGPSDLALHLDPATTDQNAVARCRDALGRFLTAHGLANAHVEVDQCSLQTHPVSGKLSRLSVQRARANLL